MEQLPSPLSLVLGGQWAGMIAGGSNTSSTFGSNPQYVISCQQATQIIISCTRLDVKFAIIKPEHQSDGCVGLLLLEPENDADGETSLGRCTSVRSSSSIKAESGFRSMEEAVINFTMEPGNPYIVIPALHAPGIEAPFELRIMSAVPVELVPLPELKCLALNGEWTPLNSGGCDMSPSWKKNPRYLLVLSARAKVKISVSRLSKGSKKAGVSSSVDDMIGLYVLQCSEPTGEIKGDLRRAKVFESTFSVVENTSEVELNGMQAYVVMPTTFGADRSGKFSICCTSSVDFDLIPL